MFQRRCDYRLNNIYGDSIHGPVYYAPFETALGDNRAHMTRYVGGVCGSLSHFGAFAALANGVPVVACDVPHGPRHLLGEGRGGLLVNREADDIASAILSLAHDRTLHDRLASEGPDIAAQYSRHRIMKMWTEEINNL